MIGKCLRGLSRQTLSRRTISRRISRRICRACRAYSPARNVGERIHAIEQMMRNFRALRCAWLGRADFKFAVHRNRIAVDDFSAENAAQSPAPERSSRSPSDQARLRPAVRAPSPLAHSAASATSARAPRDISPVADDSENEQQNRHDQQSGGFGSVDGMAVLMLVVLMMVVSFRLRLNGGVHAAIVALWWSVAGRWSSVAGR